MVSANTDVAANTEKVGLTAQQATDITTNNAKTGITNVQADAITTNNAKVGYTDVLVSANTDVVANTAKVGYTEALVSANTDVAANTAKVGITTQQATDITTNTAKVGYTDALVSANADVAANTEKVGITTQQAIDITTNNAKTGITTDQTNAIIANKSSIATNTATIGAKTSITDIVDDLTTGGTTVPLSAEQGKILKGLIESYLGSITNAVSKTSDQTIAGAKTFSETIVGNINGNATTVTNGVYTSSSVTALNDVTSVGSGAIITAAERTKLTDIKASTGLEMITEDNSTGYRLVGRNPMFYNNIGTEAVDLTSSGIPERGASGGYSFAVSLNAKADGWAATAIGESTEASGDYSLAMIRGSKASGVHSVAIGGGVRATTYGSTVFGSYNVFSTSGSADTAVGTDPLFELGNGISANNRSNAFTILKNGTITAPDFTDALITAAGDQALITKKYADANYDVDASTGLEKITVGANTGFAIIGRESMKYGPLGNGAIDMSTSYSNSGTVGATGNNSFAIGGDTEASGYFSLAGGYDSKAIGANSTAIGYRATAEGNVSVSLGGLTKATGDDSVAMGMSSSAIGNYSVAIGRNTKAINENSVALGAFNVGNSTDAIFELGNGTDGNNRSNALTILKNGAIIAPDFTDALITAAGDQALITKKYADANYGGATPKTYAVDTFYAELGGYVIEVNSTGTHGLVVAMQDQGSSNWYEANNLLSDPSKHDADGGEFKDWRIPTLRELNILHDIFRNGGNGASLTNRTYWSSTELNDTEAYAQLFNYGDDFGDNKTDSNQVRAVRAF